ncbi:hypothetical protein ATO3_15140 [Marinibacterium profundimaris]|uniref:AAA+ family ATPase n=1 Tax=Marinibacterium profundimaris TaxID=1679460 RepID=A0A225NHJ0_9RHOB|nr:hypothetical protein ATO3_15140 [Marinibacterium profundimaris]
MLILLAVPATLALAAPAMAQDDDGAPRDGIDRFFDGLRDGMDGALGTLENWTEEVGPAMRSFMEEMGPALAEMMDEVKDWSRYEAPEMLPNGDIIIRRKPEVAPDGPDTPGDPVTPPESEEDDPIEI